MTKQLQPHDLIRICGGRLPLAVDESASPAIEVCLRRAPWVVVRRGLAKDGLIPVGVRGLDRGERYGGWLDPQQICDVIKPESLRTSMDSRAARDMPALVALHECEQRFRSLCQPWGPTGSTGFELASGVHTVSLTSDLDLLLRVMERPPKDELQDIADACKNLPCAVDLQVATLHGAFSLKDYCNAASSVILRTCSGPILVRDPWRPANLDRVTP